MASLVINVLMYGCVHATGNSSLQNLHVFASSRSDTRKSSNDSPGCCTRRRKFLLSTDSLIGLLHIDDRQCFAREAQSEGLYLLALVFIFEARECCICVPLRSPCGEVCPPIDL